MGTLTLLTLEDGDHAVYSCSN